MLTAKPSAGSTQRAAEAPANVTTLPRTIVDSTHRNARKTRISERKQSFPSRTLWNYKEHHSEVRARIGDKDARQYEREGDTAHEQEDQ